MQRSCTGMQVPRLQGPAALLYLFRSPHPDLPKTAMPSRLPRGRVLRQRQSVPTYMISEASYGHLYRGALDIP